MARSLRSTRGHAGVDQRELHVLPRRHGGEEVELLEDEADAAVAHLGQRGLAHVAHVLAGQVVAARGRDVEAAQDVHQRRLARARWSDDGDVLAFVDGQAHPAQRGDRDGAGAVDLGHPLEVDDRVADALPPGEYPEGQWSPAGPAVPAPPVKPPAPPVGSHHRRTRRRGSRHRRAASRRRRRGRRSRRLAP